MAALVLMTLALLCIDQPALSLPHLPVLYLREPGSDLELDPRVQREAPAFYVVDPARYQREVTEDDDVDDRQDVRSKRKTPLSFLFFEQDGRSRKKDADFNTKEADATGSEDQQDFYNNGYALDGREATCNNFACNSKCFASSRKQYGGRCQAGRCVCSEGKPKNRRKYKKARKPTKKIPMPQ